MKIQVFGSSSAGNCVRAYTDNCPGVYFDAGVNPVLLMSQQAPLANMPILLTHEHIDHSKYAIDMVHKYGCRLFATSGTHHSLAAGSSLDFRSYCPLLKTRYQIYSGDQDIYITVFPVIHYPAAQPVCYRIEMCGESMLYLVDCGQAPDQDEIPECDIYFIEANYTPQKLNENTCQWVGIKGRVSSGFGHLSIIDTLDFMAPRITHARKIILGHLSARNFDFMEYDELTSPEFKEKALFANAGLSINTDPF